MAPSCFQQIFSSLKSRVISRVSQYPVYRRCVVSPSNRGRSFSATGNNKMVACAVDLGDWAGISDSLAKQEEHREKLVKVAREMMRQAKQAMYHLHRGEVDTAKQLLVDTETSAEGVGPILEEYPDMRGATYSMAVEEYVGAVALSLYLADKRLARSSEVPLANMEEYLGGVLGFTHELQRYAIQRATMRDMAAVQGCRDLVEALMGQYMQFDFRNSGLRKKYDGLKYTLKKMENLLYELSLVGTNPLSSPT